MCINIIPTSPWSPWWNEEQQFLHRLKYVDWVVGCRSLNNAPVCPGHRGSGPPFEMSWRHAAVPPHPWIQCIGPMQRIPTQNQQATTRWHHQERTCRDLLSLHGNNNRGTLQPECDLRYQRIQLRTTKSHTLQNKQEQAFPHQTQPGRVPAQ